jgi:protein-tyrosine-phosphatase
MVPESRSRTFTLKELVRLLEAHPGDPNLLLEPRERLADEVRRADAHRSHGLRRHPRDQDVADPLGMSLETYRAVAWELDEWCRRLADGLYGRADAPTPAGGTGA